MADPTPDPTDPAWQPPPLPVRWTEPLNAIAVGSALWLVGLGVLAALALAGVRPLDAWFWACVVGVALGATGVAVLGVQRWANARGWRVQDIR